MVAVSLKKLFFKQKTAYAIGGSDWSSDVCSSDLAGMFGFDKKAYFEAEEGSEKAPKVEF